MQLGVVDDHRAGIQAQRGSEVDGISRAQATWQQRRRCQVAVLDIYERDRRQHLRNRLMLDVLGAPVRCAVRLGVEPRRGRQGVAVLWWAPGPFPAATRRSYGVRDGGK